MRMTRFARANNATKKQPEDATSWEEMVKDFKNEGRNSEELETYTPQRKRKPPDARGKTEPRRGPVVKLAKLNISLDVNESGTKRTMQSPMKKTPPYKTRSRVKAAALRIADSTGNRNERELIGVGIDVVSKGEASQEALTPIQKTPRTRRRKRRTTSLDNGSGQVDKNDELENAKQNMVISSQKSKVKKSSGTPKKKTITVNPVVDAVKNSVVKSPDSTELRYQTPLKSQGSGEVGFAIGPVNDTKSELKTVDKILPEEYGSEKTSLKSPNSNISNKLMDTICARHSDDRDSKDIPEKESVDTVIVSKGGEVSVAISPCNNRKEANLNLSDKALSKGERNEEMVLKSPSSSTNQKLMDIASEWLPNNDNKDTLEDGDAATRLRQFDEGKLYTITKQDESELKTGSDRATPERRKLQGTVSKSFQASMSPKGLHHGIADVTSGNDVDDYVKKDCDDLNGSSQKDNIGKEMLSPNQRKYSEGKNMPNLRSGPIFSMDKLNLSVQFSDGNLKDSVGKTSPEGCDSGMTEVSVKLDANGDSTEVSQKNSAMCVTSAPKGSSNVKLAEVGVNPDVIANSTKKTVLKSPVNNNVNNQIKNEIVSHDVGDDDEMEDSDNYFELGSEDEEDDEFGEDSDENDDDDCDLDDEEEEDADTCDKVDKSTCKRPQTKNKVDKGESKFVPKVEPDSKVAKMNVGAGAIDKMSKKELNSCKTLISPPKKTVFKTSPKETVNTKESQAVSHDSDDDGEEENDSQQKSKLDKGGNKSSHKGECHPKLDKVNLIIGATDRNSKKTLAPFEKNLPSRKKTSFKTDLVEVVNNKKLQVFSHDLEDGDEKSEVDKCKNKLAPKGELDTKLAIKKLSTDAIKRITSKVLSSSQKATPSPEKIIFKTAPERAVNDKRNKIFYHDSDDEEEEEEDDDDDDDDEDDGEKEDDDDEDGGDDDDEDDGEEEEEEEDDNDDGEEEDDDEDEEEKEEEEDIFQKVKVEKGKNKPVSKGDPFSKLAQVKLNTGAKKTAFRAAPKEALNKRSREVIYQNSVDEEEDDDDEDDDDSADSRQKVKVNMTKTKPAPKDGSNSKLAKKKLSADAFERITKKGLSSTQKSTPSLEKITFKTAPEEVVNDKRNKMFYHDSDDEEEQDGDDDTEEEDDNEDDGEEEGDNEDDGEEEDDNDEDDGEEEDDNDEDDGEEEDNDDDDDDDGGDDDDDENDEDDDSDDDSADSPQKIKVNLTKTKPAPKSEFNSKLAKVQQNAVAIIGIKNKFSVYRTTTSNKQNKIMSYDDDDDTGITEWISKKLLSSPQEAITPFMQIEFKTAQKEDVNNERSKVTLFSQDSDDDDDDDDVDDDDDDVEDDDDDDDVEDDDDEEKDDNDEEKDDNDEDDEEDNDDDDSDKDNDASPQKIKVNIDKNKPQPKGEHNSKIAKVRLITGAVEEISKKELSSSQIPIPPSKKTAFKTASKGAVNDKKNKAFSHDSNDDDEEEEDGNYQIKSNGNKTCQQKRKFPAIGGPKAKVLKAQSNTDAKVSIKSDMAEQNVQTVNKTQGVIIKRFASTSIADKDHESKPSLVNIGKGMPKGGSAPSFSTIGRKAEIESASCLPIKVANHSSSNVNNAKETRFGAKCFCCRETGHKMWQCPRKEKSNTVCYKCGSAEHLSRQCKTKRSGSMPYAVCFLCNKMGHIVRNCPENTKGVYPDGGSCSICNSISHKKSECPKKRKGEKEISAVLAKRGAKGESADFQEEFTSVNAMTKQNKSKIVKF